MKKTKYITVGVYLIITVIFPLFVLFNNSSDFAKKVPSDIDNISRNYISLIKQNDVKGFSAMVSTKTVSLVNDLSKISELFSSIQLDTLKITEVEMISKDGVNYYVVSYEVKNNVADVKNQYLEIKLTVDSSENKIVGVGYVGYPVPIKELNKFLFYKQWIPFLLAIIGPLFIAYTAIRYIKKSVKPGWGILIVILIISFYASVLPKGIQLSLGLMEFASKDGLYLPTIFNIVIPIGALYYFVVRKKYEKVEEVVLNN